MAGEESPAVLSCFFLWCCKRLVFHTVMKSHPGRSHLYRLSPVCLCMCLRRSLRKCGVYSQSGHGHLYLPMPLYLVLLYSSYFEHWSNGMGSRWFMLLLLNFSIAMFMALMSFFGGRPGPGLVGFGAWISPNLKRGQFYYQLFTESWVHKQSLIVKRSQFCFNFIYFTTNFIYNNIRSL